MSTKYSNGKTKIKALNAKEVFVIQFGASLPILYSIIATISLAAMFKDNQWISFLPQTFNIPKILNVFKK